MKKLLAVLLVLSVLLGFSLQAEADGFCPIGHFTLDKYEVDPDAWLVGGFAEIDQLIYDGDNLREIVFHLVPGDTFGIDAIVVKAGGHTDITYYSPPLTATEPPTAFSVYSTVQQGISNFSLCVREAPTAVETLEAAPTNQTGSLSLFLLVVVFVILVFATGGVVHSNRKRSSRGV